MEANASAANARRHPCSVLGQRVRHVRPRSASAGSSSAPIPCRPRSRCSGRLFTGWGASTGARDATGRGDDRVHARAAVRPAPAGAEAPGTRLGPATGRRWERSSLAPCSSSRRSARRASRRSSTSSSDHDDQKPTKKRDARPSDQRRPRVTQEAETPRPPGRGRRRTAGRRCRRARCCIVMLVCLLVWALSVRPDDEASGGGLSRRRPADRLARRPGAVRGDQRRRCRSRRPTDAVSSALGATPTRRRAATSSSRCRRSSRAPHGSAPKATARSVTKTTPIRKPTRRNKLRVAVVGRLARRRARRVPGATFRPALVRVSRQGRISTGLARLDYFDWPAAM